MFINYSAKRFKKKWKVKQVSDGQYELETPLTWASFGEKISVIQQDGKLKIASTPKVPATRIDYGKNRKNIDGIERFIQG